MRVRPIAPGDTASWCRMRMSLWPGEPEGELTSEAQAFWRGGGGLQAVFLCESTSGDPLGMIELSLRSCAEGCRSMPVPYVEAWYVVPDARGRGVGRELIGAAERWARERGYPEIASDTQLENRESERAHLALGFHEVERAIHFRKDLQPTAGGGARVPSQSMRST